ncbi:MAG: RIP metalloprotease RseP [Candidatus Methylomirabilia bacterium]
MTTFVSFVIVIGILILVHELGHFFVARWMGVGVDRFSIGFGPVLLRWRRKDTEYCLSAVPMGGYVKMMGEESPVEGGGSDDVDAAKSFALKPLWVRALIVSAGPVMNFALAAMIFAGFFALVGRPVDPAVLGQIEPDGPAAQASLETGDRVVAVDGRPVTHWEDLFQAVQDADGETTQFTVRRGVDERTVALTPTRSTVRDILGDQEEVWSLGARPYLPPKIGNVLPGYPAAKAGLETGDSIVALDGSPVATWDDLAEEIRKRPGQEVELTVERGEETLTVSITPRAITERTLTGEETEVGRIGISRASSAIYVRSNPVVAVRRGLVHTLDITKFTLVAFWKLVTGQLPTSTLGGPIQIAVVAGEQARQGVTSLALFIAVISVNLAILNLLPVPMLDGGHLLFFAFEAVMGRPLSLRKRELAQQVGLVLLLLLMVFAVYNDLARIFR